METTPTANRPTESRTPLWLVLAAAIVGTAAALAGHVFAAPSAEQAPPAALVLSIGG